MTSVEAFEFTENAVLGKQGLGERYLSRLYTYKDKIHQVDASSGVTETNGLVRSKAIQVATELLAMKLTSTDVIVVCSRLHADQTAVVLGTLFAGCIVAPVEYDVSHMECRALFASVNPKMVFCDLRMSGQIERVLAEQRRTEECYEVVFGGGTAEPKSFENFFKSKPDPDFHATKIPKPKENVAFILHTQGTSEEAKLVCVSHQYIFEQTRAFLKILKKPERILSFFPLSNLTQVVMMCLSFEVPVTRILPGTITERNVCMMVHDLRIDHALFCTDFALRICSHPAQHDYNLSCLKCIILTGAPTSALTMSNLRLCFQSVKILQAYGTTETGFVAGFPEDDYDNAVQVPSSVGKLFPGVKIKVVSLDTKEILGTDCWGQLLIKGNTTMSGYLKNPEATNAAMDKGFFVSGDIGQFDADGYLYVQGTVSDIIVKENNKYLPFDIEEIILSNPSIDQVAVVGNGQEIVACVVKKKDTNMTAEKLASYIAARLPEEKVPARIKFFDSFPKTTMGKIKKKDLYEAVFNVRLKRAKSLDQVIE